jgi:hypothetical protein
MAFSYQAYVAMGGSRPSNGVQGETGGHPQEAWSDHFEDTKLFLKISQLWKHRPRPVGLPQDLSKPPFTFPHGAS